LPYFNLGNQELRAQRPAKAAELYRQAISIDPSLAQAHLYLARSYIFLGEYERALAAVRYGLKFRPDDRTGQQMLADLTRVTGG
jgi:tetratricopeptide (TPR) repeat protein